MRRQDKALEAGERLFIGVDLHKERWHVTVRTADVELWSGSILGSWESLQILLHRYRQCAVQVVYEAGCFGFWLHDRLIENGVECLVTPPNLAPQESGIGADNWHFWMRSHGKYRATICVKLSEKIKGISPVPACTSINLPGWQRRGWRKGSRTRTRPTIQTCR